MHAQTAGFIPAVSSRDHLLPPSSSSDRARRRGCKIEIFLGDGRGLGGVKVSRRSEDLYELSFFDGELEDQGSLFLTANELAHVEFAGSLQSTVEFEDHLPFALVPNDQGNLEVQDRRHAIGVRQPSRRPVSALQSLPQTEEPVPLADRLVPAPELRNVTGFAQAPDFDGPTRTTRWAIQLNPHIRLV